MPDLAAWARAYALTQLVEAPLYLYAAHRLPAAKRWFYAFGASTLTHPVLWFLFPWPHEPDSMAHYATVLIIGELYVFLTEALWGAVLHVPRPWLWSFIANVASIAAGAVLNMMLD
jgi:hypothetical protein